MNAGLLCLALCAAATPAQAQMQWTDKAFFNVNAGLQIGSQDLAVTTPFELYQETGSVASTLDVKGGGLFDISAGYKVWRNLAIGIGYSWTDSKTDAAITALVPDPGVFDAPRTLTSSASDVQHSEHAFNITGTWMIPVTDKVDVGLAFGPTFFQVSQDVPNSVAVSDPNPVITSVGVETIDESTVGFHLGVDVTYLVTPRFGVGGLARYSRGSVDLANAPDSLKIGGFQIGAGLRVRF